MKVLENTMEAVIDRWDDPGDYPNALAAGPLASYNYLAGIEGEAKIEMSDDELAEWKEYGEDWLHDFLSDFFIDQFPECSVNKFDAKLMTDEELAKWIEGEAKKGVGGSRVLVVEVLEAEADSEWNNGGW